jgi:hypothetical protein
MHTGRKEMKQRSSFEICLPLAVFAAACALSTTTCVIAILWMTVGVCSIGYRSLDEFPIDGISARWHAGFGRPCLWFYHLAWWPWYLRAELRAIAGRVSKILGANRRSTRGSGEF